MFKMLLLYLALIFCNTYTFIPSWEALWFATPLMIPLHAGCLEVIATYVALVETVWWAAPRFLGHLCRGKFSLSLFLSECFFSFKFDRILALLVFAIRMLRGEMPRLCIASGE